MAWPACFHMYGFTYMRLPMRAAVCISLMNAPVCSPENDCDLDPDPKPKPCPNSDSNPNGHLTLTLMVNQILYNEDIHHSDKDSPQMAVKMSNISSCDAEHLSNNDIEFISLTLYRNLGSVQTSVDLSLESHSQMQQ